MISIRKNIFIFLLLIAFQIQNAYCQSNASDNVSIARLSTKTSSQDTVQFDSTRVQEKAPLDIPEDRGIMITTDDGKLKMHILGSIRYLMVYDNKNLASKNTFNTAEISVGEMNKRFPNYYNGLDQTRLAFEVSRKTNKGDVFARLEMDFAGSGGFRIRHAYGQYKGLLAGQTWSLLSQVASRPTVIDNVGPTGAIIVRNPQIRYSKQNILDKTTLSVALEYLTPQFSQGDTELIQASHLVPDLTSRIDIELEKVLFQLTGILPVLTGEDMEENIVVKVGWGFSFSTKIQSWEKGKWYLQIAGGRGVTRYFNDLKTAGYDALINPSNSEAYLPLSLGGYITYEHHWSPKLFSNLTYGFSQYEDLYFASGDTYRLGNSIYFHHFYDIVEGARIGIGYNYGLIHNKDGETGNASRINVLFYYDF